MGQLIDLSAYRKWRLKLNSSSLASHFNFFQLHLGLCPSQILRLSPGELAGIIGEKKLVEALGDKILKFCRAQDIPVIYYLLNQNRIQNFPQTENFNLRIRNKLSPKELLPELVDSKKKGIVVINSLLGLKPDFEKNMSPFLSPAELELEKIMVGFSALFKRYLWAGVIFACFSSPSQHFFLKQLLENKKISKRFTKIYNPAPLSAILENEI